MSEWILINEIPSLDLIIRTFMRALTEIQFRDLIIKIHSLTGFCLNAPYATESWYMSPIPLDLGICPLCHWILVYAPLCHWILVYVPYAAGSRYMPPMPLDLGICPICHCILVYAPYATGYWYMLIMLLDVIPVRAIHMYYTCSCTHVIRM